MPWGSLSQQQITVLLRLLGAGPYKAEVTGAATATRRLGTSVEATGLAMRTATRRTFLMNQALYTFRRYAFFGTVAAITAAGALLKLGYSYLATRDSARAALQPIFKDTQAMNNELDYLFKLSKYSPFVLKDMTDALRVMYPALHGAGLGVNDMNQLLLSMTNILSQSGRTTPAALNRISYAIQHMIYQGRLTGRLVQSLASAGVNIPALLQRLGIAHENLSSIAKLNVAPQSVIKALTDLGQSGIFKGAAQRIALRSFPGMLQVLRDSMSQLMGIFLGGAYANFKRELGSFVRRGGLLDKLNSMRANQGPQAALMALSVTLTGGTGVANGLLLLLHIARNIGLIFMHSVIPAFVIALRSLVVFLPILYPLNIALGILAHHATLVKVVLIPLAASFIILHAAMMGSWIGGKLLTIMLFGQTAALKKYGLMLLSVEGRTILLNKAKRLWMILTKGEIFLTQTSGRVVKAQIGLYSALEARLYFLRLAIVKNIAATRLWIAATYEESGALGVLRGAATAAWAAALSPIVLITGAIIILAGWLYLVVTRFNQIRDSFSKLPKALEHPIRTFQQNPHKHESFAHGLLRGQLGGAFAEGGVTPFSGNFLVGEKGREVVTLPGGTTITPLSKTVGTLPTFAGSNDSGSDRPIVVQLHLNRRIIAEEVVRAQEDRQARR